MLICNLSSDTIFVELTSNTRNGGSFNFESILPGRSSAIEFPWLYHIYSETKGSAIISYDGNYKTFGNLKVTADAYTAIIA